MRDQVSEIRGQGTEVRKSEGERKTNLLNFLFAKRSEADQFKIDD